MFDKVRTLQKNNFSARQFIWRFIVFECLVLMQEEKVIQGGQPEMKGWVGVSGHTHMPTAASERASTYRAIAA